MSAISNYIISPISQITPNNFDRYKEKWGKLELSNNLVDSHPDFVQFMIDTRLAFTIVGLFNSLDRNEYNEWDTPIYIDEYGQPHLKYEGLWTSWEDLKEKIRFCDNEKIFIEQTEDSKELSLTYVYPEGFIKRNSNSYDKPFPIFQLSQAQYRAVKKLANNFFSQKDDIEDKTSILQFYTSPEEPYQQRYLKNWHGARPVHAAVRLIKKNRKLYSFGIFTNQEIIRQTSMLFILSTMPVCIKMLDAYEFHPFYKRRVTSILITEQEADKILQKIADLNQTKIRYNVFAQNCHALPDAIFKELEYPSPVLAMSPMEVLHILLPDAQDVYCGNAISKISRFCENYIPSIVSNNFLITLTTNSIMYALGGGKTMSAFEGDKEEPFWKNQGISNFSCLYPTWSSLLNPDIPKIKHHYALMEWQNQQSSTFEVDWNQPPKLHFLPSPIVYDGPTTIHGQQIIDVFINGSATISNTRITGTIEVTGPGNIQLKQVAIEGSLIAYDNVYVDESFLNMISAASCEITISASHVKHIHVRKLDDERQTIYVKERALIEKITFEAENGSIFIENSSSIASIIGKNVTVITESKQFEQDFAL